MRRLVEANVEVLEQLRATFQNMDDALWTRPAGAGSGLRVGPHIRHLLDFYSCFFAGLELGEIDYDARTRNPAIESSRPAAMRAIQSVIDCLMALTCADPDTGISVRDEHSMLRSTIGREMNCLFHHTIHHLALIAVALQSFGVAVDPGFGVAPSTLRYRQSTEAAA